MLIIPGQPATDNFQLLVRPIQRKYYWSRLVANSNIPVINFKYSGELDYSAIKFANSIILLVSSNPLLVVEYSTDKFHILEVHFKILLVNSTGV